MGRNDRPGKGVRYRPLLRGGDEPDRRLPRLDGSVIGQPCDEEALRPRFSHADRGGHGSRGARFPARARYREASHRFRRIARRNASARMGRALSGFGSEHHPHRVDHGSRSSRSRLERHRQKRDHGGPGLAGRPLLRDGTGAEGGHGGRAHGGTRHLPFRLLHGAEIRTETPGTGGSLLHGDRARLRSRELPSPSGREVRAPLRREYLPLHVASALVFRPRARARRRKSRAGGSGLSSVEPHHLLQLRLALSTLELPRSREGARGERQGRGATCHRGAVRSRFVPSRRSAADADDSRLSREDPRTTT